MSNSFHATATKERQGARNDKRSSPYYLSRNNPDENTLLPY